MSELDSSKTAGELRRAFDESFAAAALPSRSRQSDLLLLRVRGSAFAVRIDELASVSRCPRLTPLPSQSPSVLGLVGLRSGLVVVHSLAALMGESPSTLDERAILLLAAREPSVGLLADELLGHLQVEADAICSDSVPGRWSDAMVSGGGARYPLASITLFLASIRQTTAAERGSDDT